MSCQAVCVGNELTEYKSAPQDKPGVVTSLRARYIFLPVE